MSRRAAVLVSLGILVVAVAIGLVLHNVLLGLLLGAIVGLLVLLGAESRRGRNQGVNDEDHGVEL